jgi:cyclomaltodextrinase
MTRHDEFLEAFAPFTFVGNHDVTRIASKLDDPRHIAHAVVILMTVGGTPCVYYGDERGFPGTKEDRPGGDDAVRPVFPDIPAALEPVGQPLLDVHRTLIGLRRRHPWLHRARTRMDHLAHEQCVYTSHADGNALIVALNLADDPATVPSSGAATVLVGEAGIDAAAGSITLPAHGWAILAG